MATTIKTVMTYPLDGSTTDFNIPFEYLARKFVRVTLIGVHRKELILNQDYRFATKTTISIMRAWGPADGYTLIEVRRYTSATERLVDFTDGSILRAYDLNISQVQTLHVAEEARDLTADTIGINNDGDLDARGRKIVNLAFATGDYDAVPLKQIKERENSAWNAVIKSDEHANRSNNEANRSRDEADRARREADRSTQQAGVSTAQAVESKTQADRSNSEANRARDEANRASGEVTKAAAEVAKAAAHVDTAKGHADRSNSAANRSKSEADRAKSEADKLGNMNALAGAIRGVEGYYVTWRGPQILEGSSNQLKLVRISDDTSSYIQGSYADGSPDWYLGKLDAGSDITLTRRNGGTLELTNSGFTRLQHGGSGIKIADGGIEYTSPFHTFDGGFRTKPAAGHRSHTVYVGGTERNELRLITDQGTEGAFINALNGDWYDCWWKIGGVRGWDTDLPSVDLWVYNTGRDEARYTFGSDGSIRVNNRGFTLTRNGDISGSLWGGWLSSWLGNNTVNHIAMGEVNWAQLWRAGGVSDGGGKVITGIINTNGDDLADFCQWRVMQYVRNNGQRFNIY